MVSYTKRNLTHTVLRYQNQVETEDYSGLYIVKADMRRRVVFVKVVNSAARPCARRCHVNIHH